MSIKDKQSLLTFMFITGIRSVIVGIGICYVKYLHFTVR